MAAGDRTDPIGHRHDGKAEREGDAEDIDRRRVRRHATDHGGAATEEDEGKGTDELCDGLFHVLSAVPAPAA